MRDRTCSFIAGEIRAKTRIRRSSNSPYDMPPLARSGRLDRSALCHQKRPDVSETLNLIEAHFKSSRPFEGDAASGNEMTSVSGPAVAEPLKPRPGHGKLELRATLQHTRYGQLVRCET